MLKKSLNFFIPFLVACILMLPFSVFAQEEDNPFEESQDIDWEDAPLYLSGGANLSRVYGKEFPVRFDYKFFAQGGFLFKYSLFMKYPFYTGLEYVARGYEYDQTKTGFDFKNRYFEDKVKGSTTLGFLSIPILFQIKASKPSERFHFLAGANMGIRVFYFESFEASRNFPNDSIFIPVSYKKYGNDALDFFEFNAVAGARYKLLPRLEIMFLASYKLFGISISKENFFTRTELQNGLSLKLLYRIGSMRNLPFF